MYRGVQTGQQIIWQRNNHQNLFIEKDGATLSSAWAHCFFVVLAHMYSSLVLFKLLKKIVTIQKKEKKILKNWFPFLLS